MSDGNIPPPPRFPVFPPRRPAQMPPRTRPPPAKTPVTRQPVKKEPAKQQPKEPLPSRFPFKVGISVFGTPSYFNIDAAISEFQNFVQANSKLDLKITINKHSKLGPGEIHVIPGTGGRSFADPKYLKPETRAKLPSDSAVKIAIYDLQNTTTYWGGATYPASTLMKVPYIGIPFGDSIRSWGVETNWKTRTATALVHEFYHAINQILARKGHKLPNPDKANDHGYTTANDPGWIKFDKFLYGQITDAMYLALTQ
jgi:hypothetical protein